MASPPRGKDMSDIKVSGSFNICDTLDIDGGIQMQFAALQLKMAQANKEKAKTYMDEIKGNQEKVKECAQMIAKARELQNTVKSKGTSEMPADMVQYFKDNGMTPEQTGSDNLHDKDEWEYNIKSLQNHQETLNTNSQQLMVYVQDFMGQYNSYLTGANSAIQQSNQTLGTIARGQ
jgi:hypothetical protein